MSVTPKAFSSVVMVDMSLRHAQGRLLWARCKRARLFPPKAGNRSQTRRPASKGKSCCRMTQIIADCRRDPVPTLPDEFKSHREAAESGTLTASPTTKNSWSLSNSTWTSRGVILRSRWTKKAFWPCVRLPGKNKNPSNNSPGKSSSRGSAPAEETRVCPQYPHRG